MPPEKIRVRPASSDEREALVALKCRVWPELDAEMERRRRRWLFDENPGHAPERPEALVAEEGGRLVGMLTTPAHRVLAGGEVFVATDGIDFCVEARLRGRGVGKRLVAAWMRPEFCDFSFTTTPTDVSVRIMAGEGRGRLLGSVHETVAHAFFADGREPPAPPAGAPEVVEAAAFGGDFDALWERVARGRRLLLVRDRRTLEWRYGRFPFARPRLLEARDAAGRLAGAAVLLAHEEPRRMYVCELLAPVGEDGTALALLSAAARVFGGSGLEALFCATRDPWLRGLLAAARFDPVPGEVPKFLGRWNRGADRPDVRVEDWSVSLGDGDQLYDVGTGR